MLVAILVEWRIDAQDYVAKQREKANVVRNRMVPSGSYCFLPASGQLLPSYGTIAGRILSNAYRLLRFLSFSLGVGERKRCPNST